MLKHELRAILEQQQADASWLDCLTLRQEEHTLRVSFPHPYYASWFGAHKRGMFEQAVSRFFGARETPALVYDHPIIRPVRRPASPPTADLQQRDRPALAESDPFVTFLTNAKNAFPLAAAREFAARNADTACDLLLLHGCCGTGKSHLLRAMATELERSKHSVILADATRFCAESSQWAQHPENFWQQCGALLLDDLQRLCDKEEWQLQLAVLVDAMPRGAGAARLALACDAPLPSLHERLRSRLESGLVLELQEPDLDVRLRFLELGARECGLSIGRQQLFSIAQRCPQFRLLQGLLRKMTAFRSLTGADPTPDDMETMVCAGMYSTPPTCLEILSQVAGVMHLNTDEILSGRRRPDLVLARQLAMFVCRRKLGLSYPELGRAFGGKDHSTVIHAIKKIEKLIDSDKSVRQLLSQLEQYAA